MPKAVLTISSKNYGAWALRGWLMAKLSGLEFTEDIISPDDAAMKAEILLLSSSMLVPSLLHNGIKVWDTLAIGEYLNEIKPKAGLLPADTKARAHCRAVCGEMHSGFSALRGSLPMNIQAHYPNFKVWSRAQSHRPCGRHLEGMPGELRRPFPVWCPARHGRRHVRPGGDTFPDLRRAAGRGVYRLLSAHDGAAADAGVGGCCAS